MDRSILPGCQYRLYVNWVDTFGAPPHAAEQADIQGDFRMFGLESQGIHASQSARLAVEPSVARLAYQTKDEALRGAASGLPTFFTFAFQHFFPSSSKLMESLPPPNGNRSSRDTNSDN